jgi:superfamily II DNA or RNA helicase
MSNYLSKRGYVLRKENFKDEELFEIKKILRARPLTDTKFLSKNNEQTDTSFPVYIETKNKLYIPKMFGIEKFGFPESCLDNYNGKSWETDDIIFNGSLYENQKEPCDLLIKSCKENGGGILHLNTGFGKTICLLYVLSQLKCKTIVVVNKIPLMKQWQSEIAKFLPNAKVGIIQGQKNVDVEGKDIVIAMLQSLTRIDYPDSLFSDISLTVIDEVHNTASQMFSKILFKLSSKYTIGLSATPTRADGCEYVFKWHLGDIVYKSTVERKGKAPIIRHLKIDSSDYKEICMINKFTGQKTVQFTSMLSELIEMEKRNKLIIEIIKDCRKHKRRILVLSDRRNHLQGLYKLLETNTNISFTYGLFLGSMKIADLEKSKACDVILATYAAFGEGVSEKDLDTLILTTPKKFIGHLKNTTKNESGKLEQIIGRIFRKEHKTLEPMIIDFQDNFSVYKTQSAGRRKFYKEHFQNVKFENQSINLDDFTLDTLNISSINTKSVKEINDDNEQNNQNYKGITQFCLLED